ncbi:MAG: amino acid adenylation domain-containing protein, partial [Planctomycetota bacterium]
EKHVPLSIGAKDDEDFSGLTKRALAALEQALDDHDAWDATTDSAPEVIPHAFAWRTAFDASAGGRSLWASARLGQSDISRITVSFEGLNTGPKSDCLVLRVSAAGEAMDHDAAEAVADQVLALILDATGNPSTSAAHQSAASEAWCTQLKESLSHTPSNAPRAKSITELLSQAVQANPSATAVQGKESSLSYAELDSRTNRIARYLRKLGVGPGKFVGLYFERDVQMIEAMIGVLKAGGAYLPLPPTYPDDRVCFMLKDTGAEVVMTSTLSSGGLPSSTAQVLILDQLESELSTFDSGPIEAVHVSDDPAYVIFTSGSTGKPKGVPITHGNLCHSTLARGETYGAPVSAYLLLSSFAFDSSVPGIFWTLSGGGVLVLPPEGAERELGQLPKLVKQHGISHLLALPSVYGLLLESSKGGELNSLQVVIVAGESAAPELVTRHSKELPDCALFDEYGPTENTVWSTVQRCSTDDAFFTVPIGRPVPGIRAFVAEADSSPPKPVAAGMPGELLVGGPQLSPGYLGRPELTAERFVDDTDGQRLYRTGDLARMHPSGTLEFLGRLDHQVKLRGYRIELEEIEAVLAERDEVQEAVVNAPDFASGGNPSDRRLVAYVLAAGADLDVKALRAHLTLRLPEYMVPAHITVLDELPRLPNGKVDRRALPVPTAEGHSSTAGVDSTASALERLIAHIWAELLECETVAADEDFFDLGGHSLLAARFFAQLNETLQIDAPLRYLFDNPTVRGLAAAIGEAEEDGPRATRAAEIAVQVLGLGGAAEASTSLERLVGSLWATGLAVDSVEPEEDFFDLGGHSLLAARLFAQMNELLQVEAPLRLLFDNPTVRSLCAGLSNGDTAEAARLERTAELTLQVMESE